MPVFRPIINRLDEELTLQRARLQKVEEQRQSELGLRQPTFRPPEPISVEEAPRFETPTIAPSRFRPFEFSPVQPFFTPEEDFSPSLVKAPIFNVPRFDPVAEIPELIPEVEKSKWWEQPKLITEKATEKLGKGISKVPILPEALEFLAPAFEFIHEKLEKPFAAIITSPFSPDLPWERGESWGEHQKREYDAWNAPVYVKGAAEFGMPLWWMPWFSWAKVGAKALGAGSKAATAIAKSGKLATVAERGLPSSELLDKVLFKGGRFSKFARFTEKVPVLNRLVKMVGGEGVFAHPTSTNPLQVTRRALVKSGFISDMRNGVKSLLTPKLQVLGKVENLLKMDARGVVGNIVDKTGKSQYLYDVLEGAIKNPDNYKFLTKESLKYVDELRGILDDVYTLARKEGVKVPKKTILHRIVKGKTNPKTGVYEKSEYGSLFEVERSHVLQRSGAEAGVDYGLSINESISSTIDHYMRKIAEKRFVKEVGKLGKTPTMMWRATPESLELEKLLELGTKGILKHSGRISELNLVKKQFMKHYRGTQILGENLAKFNRHPVFKQTIFPKEVVKTAEKVLNDTGEDWLRTMSNISGTSRMLVAALDLSAPFIQGLAVLGRNPVAWASAVKDMLRFAVKPQNFYKYMTDPAIMATRMERILAGGSSSTFEFFQALAPLQKAAGRVPLVGKAFDKFIGASYGRAETAFTGFGEAARNNMWRALRKPNMTPEALMDLSRTLDRMTGVMSTEALAIGRTQQNFENAFVFFAPRYTRAGLSFVGDALKGGMAGAEARKSLGAMMGGGLAMYYGVTSALGQQPNLNPNSARFMTIKVGDSHIGIGGIMTSLIRFAYDVGVTAVEDPANLIRPLSEGSLNRWDNPFIRFLYARTAPLTSTVMQAVEQTNYFGEPFENVGDWGRFMADKITPIAVQGVISDPDPAVAAAEFGGLRAFPKSPWELMDEERDKIAVRETGQIYENLTDLDQTRVDKFETIQKLQEDIDAQVVSRGDAVSVGFLNRQRERDSARQVYEETIQNLQGAFDAGVIKGFEFREKLGDAGYGLGATYKHIDRQPEYKDVLETLREPKVTKDKHIVDIAYSEFMDKVYETDKNGISVFEDQFGIFQYDTYNAYIESFRQKYGNEVHRYVLERKAERDANLPPLYHEFQRAKEVLRPYWQVRDRVERLFKKRFTESPRGQALISKYRKNLRLRNPEMERAYQQFYSRG